MHNVTTTTQQNVTGEKWDALREQVEIQDPNTTIKTIQLDMIHFYYFHHQCETLPLRLHNTLNSRVAAKVIATYRLKQKQLIHLSHYKSLSNI